MEEDKIRQINYKEEYHNAEKMNAMLKEEFEKKYREQEERYSEIVNQQNTEIIWLKQVINNTLHIKM